MLSEHAEYISPDSCCGIEETYDVHERTHWSGGVNEMELHRLDTARKDETNCDECVLSDEGEKESDKFGYKQHYKEGMESDGDSSKEDHTHENRARRPESVHTSRSSEKIAIQPKVQCSTPHSNKSSTSRVKLLKRMNTCNYTHKKPKLKKREWNWKHKKKKVDWHIRTQKKRKEKRFRCEDYQHSSEGKMHRKQRAEKQWKRKKKTVKRFRLKK